MPSTTVIIADIAAMTLVVTAVAMEAGVIDSFLSGKPARFKLSGLNGNIS